MSISLTILLVSECATVFKLHSPKFSIIKWTREWRGCCCWHCSCLRNRYRCSRCSRCLSIWQYRETIRGHEKGPVLGKYINCTVKFDRFASFLSYLLNRHVAAKSLYHSTYSEPVAEKACYLSRISGSKISFSSLGMTVISYR